MYTLAANITKVQEVLIGETMARASGTTAKSRS